MKNTVVRKNYTNPSNIKAGVDTLSLTVEGKRIFLISARQKKINGIPKKLKSRRLVPGNYLFILKGSHIAVIGINIT